MALIEIDGLPLKNGDFPLFFRKNNWKFSKNQLKPLKNGDVPLFFRNNNWKFSKKQLKPLKKCIFYGYVK